MKKIKQKKFDWLLWKSVQDTSNDGPALNETFFGKNVLGYFYRNYEISQTVQLYNVFALKFLPKDLMRSLLWRFWWTSFSIPIGALLFDLHSKLGKMKNREKGIISL